MKNKMITENEVKESFMEDQHREYHRRQYTTLYRSTYFLMQFIESHIDSNLKYQVIDVGTGGGANIYHLSKIMHNTKWIGFDWADKYFNIGRRFLKDIDYEFIKGDFYKLKKIFNYKSFDISFCLQTLSWLPGYEKLMKQLFDITKKYIIITSLFTDFNIDANTLIYEYSKDNKQWKSNKPYYYNIYCYNKFRDFCMKNNALEVISQDFVIDIDLPKPKNNIMKTYTIKTESSKRIQFSGPLHMPWKMIIIRMK